MTFVKEPISSLDLIEKHREHLFHFGIRTGESIGSHWMVDKDANAYLVGLGGLGPGLSGYCYALIWNDEVVKFYAEAHETSANDARSLEITVYGRRLYFPKAWDRRSDKEQLQQAAKSLICEAIVGYRPYKKDFYKEIVAQVKNLDWDN